MKKIISIVLYTLITIQLFSQTAYKNFQKYQYFRQRLRDDFVIVDSTNRQGTNIPASSRNRWGGWLEYTENPMIESFLPYMELLATEYAVNKKYGLDNTRTLNELSYLLLAIERIDLNAEKFFRAQMDNPPLNTHASDFWIRIDDYINPDEDLNGFFLRSDIDSYSKENRIYYEDETRYIYNYNDKQLKYVDYYDDSIRKATSVFNYVGGVQTNNRSVMSQDEVASLFMGLALTAKLVDDSRLFTDTEGEQVTIRRWCGKIAYRTMFALYNDTVITNKWRIYNPVTGEKVRKKNGGITRANSVGFQFASLYIIDLDTANSQEAIDEHINILSMDIATMFDRTAVFVDIFSYVVSHSIKKGAYFIPYNLGIIAFDNSLKSTIRFMKKNTNKIGKITFEFQPMIYSLLHDVDLQSNWKKLNNFITYDQYVDSIEMLLNVMPECGSYVDDTKGVYSDYYWINNRHDDLNKLNANNFCEVYDGSFKLKINSDMDYMILFNLYYLVLSDDYLTNISTSFANINYPASGNGSHSNPAVFYGKNFSMNHKISEEGDVSIVAEDYIELLPGFEVKEGGTFVGKTGVYKPDCDFNFTGTYPCAPDKSADMMVLEQVTKTKKENTDFKTYKIYPNPVTNYLYVDFGKDFTPDLVQLVDFSGKTIREYIRPANSLDIDFSELPNNLYFLIIENNNEIYTEKIIKK